MQNSKDKLFPTALLGAYPAFQLVDASTTASPSALAACKTQCASKPLFLSGQGLHHECP